MGHPERVNGGLTARQVDPSSRGVGYWRRILTMLLFLSPLAYVGGILAVAIHEILGHGLASAMMGGRFIGFALRLDGMGWSRTILPRGAPQYQHVIHLAGGAAATTIAGLAFLAAASASQKNLLLRMLFVLFAANCLLEGLPYVFWNSYHPVPPGDVGRILAMAGTPGLRWGLMIGSGAMSVAAVTYTTALVFQGVEQWVGAGTRLAGRRRIIPLVLLGAGEAGMWCTFDWNQLAPGIGVLPIVVGALVSVATVTGLYWVSLPVRRRPGKPTRALPGIVAAWAATGAVVGAILLWFDEGVFWG